MKLIEIVATCDACAAWQNVTQDQDVETVTVGGQTLDLCGEHRTTLRPLLALVAEWGVTSEKPERGKNRRGGARARARRQNAATVQDDGRAPCLRCDSRMLNSDSLGIHVRKYHNVTMTEMFGGRCPLCEHDSDPSGLGSHARMVHEIRGGAARLFAVAASQGDPLGVYASRARAELEAAGS